MNIIHGGFCFSAVKEFPVIDEDIKMEENGFPEDVALLNKRLSASFEIAGESTERLMIILSGLYDAALSAYQNRRVCHLVKNARKERVRKKNQNRIFRMLEKIR